jgi:hypothetical protein
LTRTLKKRLVLLAPAVHVAFPALATVAASLIFPALATFRARLVRMDVVMPIQVDLVIEWTLTTLAGWAGAVFWRIPTIRNLTGVLPRRGFALLIPVVMLSLGTPMGFLPRVPAVAHLATANRIWNLRQLAIVFPRVATLNHPDRLSEAIRMKMPLPQVQTEPAVRLAPIRIFTGDQRSVGIPVPAFQGGILRLVRGMTQLSLQRRSPISSEKMPLTFRLAKGLPRADLRGGPVRRPLSFPQAAVLTTCLT